jgi:predicted nucleotide-binding protein
MSRDAGQMMKGRIAPQHVVAQAYLHSVRQNGERALRLASQIRRIIGIVEMTSASSETSQALNRVFVGHGQDPHWRELWDFISTRLHLSAEEFNSISAAGLPTTDRLKEMLERSNFAFLVFTAEDEHADETMHARENVIHEAGLFQGRLGFRRAIVVLEEGCAEFSNLTGLGQIRFPPRSNLSLF